LCSGKNLGWENFDFVSNIDQCELSLMKCMFPHWVQFWWRTDCNRWQRSAERIVPANAYSSIVVSDELRVVVVNSVPSNKTWKWRTWTESGILIDPTFVWINARSTRSNIARGTVYLRKGSLGVSLSRASRSKPWNNRKTNASWTFQMSTKSEASSYTWLQRSFSLHLFLSESIQHAPKEERKSN
jgi:hypothetical protein